MIVMRKIFGSSVGRKSLMAVSGLALTGFLLGHLAGNLLVFAGPEAINSYAKGLLDLGALLWVIRSGLLIIFVLHIYFGITLTIENKRARPIAYSCEKTIQASLASRSMHITGLVILFYLIFHLAHFTIGVVDPSVYDRYDASGRHDVYNMIIYGFQNPIFSVSYILAMMAMALHLSHGLPSLFQSMGLSSDRFTTAFKKTGIAVAIFLFIGFTSIPVAVWIGFLRVQA